MFFFFIEMFVFLYFNDYGFSSVRFVFIFLKYLYIYEVFFDTLFTLYYFTVIRNSFVCFVMFVIVVFLLYWYKNFLLDKKIHLFYNDYFISFFTFVVLFFLTPPSILNSLVTESLRRLTLLFPSLTPCSKTWAREKGTPSSPSMETPSSF